MVFFMNYYIARTHACVRTSALCAFTPFFFFFLLAERAQASPFFFFCFLFSPCLRAQRADSVNYITLLHARTRACRHFVPLSLFFFIPAGIDGRLIVPPLSG